MSKSFQKVKNKVNEIFGFHDLTVGDPLKVILVFAIPILLANILNQGLSLLNSLVLKATVGGDSVTAMNQTGSFQSLLFNFAFGCSSGFGVICGKYFGSKNQEDLKKAYYQSFSLMIIIALVITILGFIVLPYLVEWLNVPLQYRDQANEYFKIMLIGFVLMAINNLVANMLRAFGNSVFPLFTSFIFSLTHIFFVYILTSKNLLNLDVKGCAIANLINYTLTTLVSIIYLLRHHTYLKGIKNFFKFDKKIAWDLLKLGLPLGFQWSVLFIGSFVQNSQINKYGADASKAMTCYSSWEGYLTLPLSTMAAALLNYVSQNYGAKKYKRIKIGIKKCLLIDAMIYLVMLAIGLSTAKVVPYIFLNDSDVNSKVIYYCSTYLYILVPSLILQGCLQLSRSSLQGTTNALIPFLSGLGELAARIAVSLLLPYIIDNNYETTLSDNSYIGVCFSNTSAWVASFLIMGLSTFFMILNNKKYDHDEEIEEKKEATK